MVSPDTQDMRVSESSALQRISRPRPSQDDGWALPDEHERNVLKTSPGDWCTPCVAGSGTHKQSGARSGRRWDR